MPMFGFGYGRGPRRGGGGFLLLFFLFMFAPELLFGVGLIYLLPIVIGGVAVWGIIKAIKSSLDSRPKQAKATKVNVNNTRPENMSNADLSRIDKKLSTFFKNNVSLPIIEDIALVPSGGKYSSIDQLYITYKEEKVLKLADFKEEHFGMYNRIVELLNEFSKKSETIIKEEVNKPDIKEEDILSDAQKYINKINDLNAAIPQEEITNGLYQTCDLLKKIELSKQSKQDKQKLTKLYDYYLPILTGILENYKNLQDRAIKDDEFVKCESQLIKTIMLINQALKTLYSEMHEDDYLDINADMETLQTLIKKDGFGEDPFKTEGK